jgi:hypothetical protein
MNLAAPVARPASVWNHDTLMRKAAPSLVAASLTSAGGVCRVRS